MMKTTWTTVGTLSIDSGFCAFADISVLSDRIELPATDSPVVDLTPQGLGLIACFTREDHDIPVEKNEELPGARMEFVTDVEELAGSWERIGQLNLPSGRCVACDPYIFRNDFYRIEFELPAGRYAVEVFRALPDNDILGIRLKGEG